MARTDPPLQKTPALERALTRLRSRMVLLVALHGLGTVLAVSAVWLVFAFIADWGLHVPRPVRMFHSVIVILLPAWFLWRELVRPLRRIPDRSGLAVLLEREDPELHELLVSAADFQRAGAAADGDPELIERVWREADERAAQLDTGSVLDPGKPSLRLFAGLACAGVTATMFLLNPAYAGIFFHRLLGQDVAWPQRTQLDIEVPGLVDVTRTREAIDVRVAHGSDVPVVVRARGISPDTVTLHFGDGAEKVLPQGSESTYRHLLPSVSSDLELYVTGGDDRDRLPLVRLQVLQPPDVAGIAVRTRPPSYSGLPVRLDFNRDVEVLQGSELEVHLLPSPAEARGIARVLPENRALELEPAPFPNAADAMEGAAESPGLTFRLLAGESVRYRFELVDEAGLTNPDPGLYSITVIEDGPPEVQLQAPGQTEVETVVGGALPLRVAASDDFGLVSLNWRSSLAREEEPLAEGALAWRDPGPDGATRLEGMAATRLDVSQLAGEVEVAEGAAFALEVRAVDNRVPEPGVGRSASVRVRVVSSDELMRRVRDRLSRVRAQAAKLAELQSEKRRRVEELLEGLSSDELTELVDGRALSMALNGERLVSGDASSLSRELAAVVETILYARLDEQAGALFEELDRRMRAASGRSFQARAWSELVADYERGDLGGAGLAGNLTGILGIALAISEVHTPAATAALERAQDAEDIAALRAELELADNEQGLALARIEDLLERLAEWDSFQSVLALTRDILDRQSNLRQRTQRFASEK